MGDGTLGNLYQASCDLYALVKAEYLACQSNPGQCPGDIGAYARNGGPSSKLAKMCHFRVLNMIEHCGASLHAQAHTDVIHAENAMENWIGQTVRYVRAGQLPGSYAEAYFGFGVVASAILDPPTTIAAQEAMWALAAAAGKQNPIEATALSILADLKYRLDRPTVCD